MKKNLLISIWFTLATTVLLGIVYPLVVTGLAQVIFPKQANGELIHAGRKARRLASDRPAVHARRDISIRGLRRQGQRATIPLHRADRISARRTRC